MRTIKKIFVIATFIIAVFAASLGVTAGRVAAFAATEPSVKWNMSLGEDIGIKFYIEKTAGEGAYIIVSIDGKEERSVMEYTTEENYFLFVYDGLAPQLMTKNVSVSVYSKENVFLCSKESTLQTYLKNILDGKTNGDESIEKLSETSSLARLVVSLLNYGATAQDYVGDEGERCDSFLSEENYSSYTSESFTAPFTEQFKAVTTQNVSDVIPTAAYLYLAYNTEVCIEFSVGNTVPNGAYVTVGGKVKVCGLAATNGGVILSIPLSATEIHSEISAVLTCDGVEVGYTLTGSAAGYIGGQTSDEADKKIVKALYAYCKSAELYSTDYTEFYAVKNTTELESGFSFEGTAKIQTNRPNNAGRHCIGNLDGNLNNGLTFTFKSSSANKDVALYAEFGKLEKANNFADWCSLMVNGEKVAVKAAMPYDSNYLPSNEKTFLGYISLDEGENVVKLSVTNKNGLTGHNFYALTFGATGVKPVNVDWSNENVLYATEKGQARLASYVTVSGGNAVSYPSNRVNSAGYYPIGNVNGNPGLKTTFKINSDTACNAKLYAEFCNKPDAVKFSSWCNLSVNEKTYTSTALMQTGTAWTPTNTFILISEVSLNSGDNEIVFYVFGSNGYNIYGIKLVCAQGVTITGVSV